jgi:2-keto-4-pentenoate hydratase
MNNVIQPGSGAPLVAQDSASLPPEDRPAGFRVTGANKTHADYTLTAISADVLHADNAVCRGEGGTVFQAAPALAFRFSRAIDRANPSIADIIAAVDFVLPAATVDDGAGGTVRVVLGSRPGSLSAMDLRLCGTCMEKNGEAIAFGAGASAGGNPLAVVSWAASELLRQAHTVKEGDLIVIGPLSEIVDAKPDDWIRISINRLGSINFRVEQAS